MCSRFRVFYTRMISLTLGMVMLTGLLLAAAWPAAAEDRPGLYSKPENGRAVAGVVYLYMHETTSLQANGDGEERVEFLITNDSLTPITTDEFYFTVGATDFWGIEAWDESGSLDYGVVVQDNEVHITIYLRHSVSVGHQYRYFFAINFPTLAQESGGEWALNWGTYFPVAEFVRTVNLPGGGEVTYTNPAPTEQTAGFVRWVRFAITEFIFNLRYTLRPLTQTELAEEFAPYFRMHADDVYVPMDVNTALKHAECYIKSGAQPQACSIGLLGGSWQNAGDSYIDFNGWPGGKLGEEGSSQQIYVSEIKSDADAAPVVYARVVPVGADRTVIQYWLYYYYNSWGLQGGLWGSLHEGDWEMVQVVLNGDEQPLYAVYAQHFGLTFTDLKGGSKKEWNDLKPGRNLEDSHPIVYPGLGSHASYFGPYPYLHNRDQTASAATELIKPTVHLLQPNGNDAWVSYRGKWGEKSRLFKFQTGPDSPGNPDAQGAKWNNPLGWAEETINWDEYAGHHIGKVRAHIAAPCNVGVFVNDTNLSFGWVFNKFREEIDGGEYIVNESINTRSLILHNTYKLATWLYTLYVTCPNLSTPSARDTTAPPTLTVEYYDADADELVTAVYELPADWTPETTIGALTFDDPAEPILAVDDDNDGDTDRLVPPVSVVSEPIEEPVGTGQVLVPLAMAR